MSAAVLLGVASPAGAASAGLHRAGDGEIDATALAHDSHSDLYRVPFNDVHPGGTVTLRFRTAHDDVSGVLLWQSTGESTVLSPMTRVAAGADCYDAALSDGSCDFWQIQLFPAELGEINYRFVVDDGPTRLHYSTATYPYGGSGAATPDEPSGTYLVHVVDDVPVIPWLADGVIYQVFPDRFANGDPANDPAEDEPRYDYPAPPDATPEQKEAADLAQIELYDWADLPEGYCRAYVAPATPCTEQALGRDFFGGDLDGVREKLDYLQDLGVTAIYLNPIFDGSSNHFYDVRDHSRISPWLGGDAAFQRLAAAAHSRGMRIILDGPFAAVSSDGPFFDRYQHFPELGACESAESPYRSWFTFHDAPSGPCAGSAPGLRATYDGWMDFEPLPLLDKSNPEVRDYFYAADGSIGQTWLQNGADGWRLDSMHHESFPLDYWQGFRVAAKQVAPDAPLIGEAFLNSQVLTRGDTADTEMGYRFWWAEMSLLGGNDGQDSRLSTVLNQFVSIQQDYPSGTAKMYMNLLSSHDTARVLWRLTPGANNREDREFDAANLAVGTQKEKIAVTVQFTMPGTPSIYYGDEIGLTGDNDPDNRRPFPWDGGDESLLTTYQSLAELRSENPVLSGGDLRFLLADDAQNAMAYAMRDDTSVAVVVVNRGSEASAIAVPTAGYLPDGVEFDPAFGPVTDPAATAGGALTVTLPALSAQVLVSAPDTDVSGPSAPSPQASAESDRVTLSWRPVQGAGSYVVERSPLTGGGYVQVGEVEARGGKVRFVDSGLAPSTAYFYRVRAVDSVGNLGTPSAEIPTTTC